MKKNILRSASCIIIIAGSLLLGACDVDVAVDDDNNMKINLGQDDGNNVKFNVEQGTSDRQDILLGSDEHEQLEKEVFEANQLDKLFKNHKSIVIECTEIPDDLGWIDYYYMTKDACYREDPSTAEYDYDRCYYQLHNDNPDGEPRLYYGVDLRSDYDLLADYGHQIVPYLEEEWFRSDLEEHLECYIEDGLVYMRDRNNEESSKELFESLMPNETYGDEIVYSEAIADADTKEILEFNTYLESPDGTMRPLICKKVSYDAEEPRNARNLRAAAERYCENMIDVTFTVDPGTDHELSKSMTMPVGSVVNYVCDNMENDVTFDNAEATELTHWDGMKSKSIYIFTDPTKEQQETYEKLLSEIKKDDALSVTIQDIAMANNREAAFSRHKNWITTTTPSEDNDCLAAKACGLYGFTSFSENGKAYFDTDYCEEDGTKLNEKNLITQNNDYYINDSLKDGQVLQVSWYLMPDDEKTQRRIERGADLESKAVFGYDEDVNEELDGVTDNGDGTITVDTHVSVDDAPEIVSVPDEWKGGRVEYTYVLNKDDLEMKGMTSRVVTDSGSYDFITETVDYDCEAPEGYNEMSGYVEDFENGMPKNPKTITITYDPETENEEVYTLETDTSYSIAPVIREGYGLYKDPEGKTPFKGSDGKTNVEIYAIKEN